MNINQFLRKFVNYKNRKRLTNKSNFSLISSNCNGAFILHDLGLKFNSPFVNLWLKPKDFIKYLENIEHYKNANMQFIHEDGISYPIGKLDDINIYFQHYKTEEEALSKWIQRTERIDINNIFILFTDRDECTYEDLVRFDNLNFKNKIVFTHIPYPEIKSSFYIKGFESDSSVGFCHEYKNDFSGHRILDQFDYVEWFNRS